ncbi:ADR225Wp [Eremothecium gossypii ATCC 10895]|uniref:ADR225Wp n=1 Tax=Eremothecium gossypii (strain ATCC 10895 / CBS 109.51 / FGSC 9923 / NRRL Y-1056) TaxID=284811 RepID=Q759P8_EREGS|nr:ADR225Wp [Eremothecium gossypii ATCC 10895]AAS52145.1 ADR225Wp [Eremothecium gossypii ATCC 10895]AEY96444.1 FADR225Wp [Eremothecium gossypii FDAG1]
MGKAEFGTAKYISNQLKARGLQKLRFYCQICQKQCRDDNGFQSHIKSPSHLRKISTITPKDIDQYTKQFERDFLRLLHMGHGEKKIEANKFYNEYIQDKHHIHMNATRYTSLTKFIQHLSKTGKIRVHGVEELEEDMDPGQILISYIDNSSDNMLKKDKLRELEENDKHEEDIRQNMLLKQIEFGKKAEQLADVPASDEVPGAEKPAVIGKVSLRLETKNKVKKKKSKGTNVFKKA